MKLPHHHISPLLLSSLPLLFLVLIHGIAAIDNYAVTEATVSNPLIVETCEKAAKTDPNLKFGFCISALQSAPNSLCADSIRKLGLISVELLKANVTSTRCYTKYLLRDKKIDPYVRSCLNDCLELYSDALPTLKQATKDYKAKRYANANVEVSSVTDAATTCEDGFEEKEGVVSPLKKRNDDVFRLSALALSIINMLPGRSV